MKYKVIGWTNYEDTTYPAFEAKDYETLCGVRIALIEEILEHDYAFSGEDHHYVKGCVPVLNTGEVILMGQRGWGSVMAQAYGENNDDGYAYAKWFLSGKFPRRFNYPKEGVDISQIVPKDTVFEVDIPEDFELYGTGPKDYAKSMQQYMDFINHGCIFEEKPKVIPSHPMSISKKVERDVYNLIYSGKQTAFVFICYDEYAFLEKDDTLQFVQWGKDENCIGTVVKNVTKFKTVDELYKSDKFKKLAFKGSQKRYTEEFLLYDIYYYELREFGVCIVEFEVVYK